MESKRLIEIVEKLDKRSEGMQADINQIKIELAKNEQVNKLEIRMGKQEDRMFLVYWILGVIFVAILSAAVAYFNK